MKRIFLVFFLVVGSSSAFSHQIDGIEHIFGATNINGISGNGSLTVGVSREGDLTLLKYPSPSYFDQLNYKTSSLENARELQFFGAEENMGAFSGLIVHRGSQSELTWLRDGSWEKSQYYNSDDSAVLVTEYRRDDYKISVRQLDFVLPENDVYVRHHEIELLPGSEVTSLELVFYENLAPCNYKEPFVPTYDWSDDSKNDFALLYYSKRDLFVHFRPETIDFSRVKTLMLPGTTQSEIDYFVDDIIAGKEMGIYAVIGGKSSSSSHQAGMDSVTVCTVPEISSITNRPEDAYSDIQDMVLSGSSVALCQANGVFVFPVELSQFRRGEAALFISFGTTLSEAMYNYETAVVKNVEELLYEAESFWNEWLKGAQLPASGDSDLMGFSKRTLISARISTDRDTGAIVASVSTQPPYGEDWPRDGAFINLALDVSGFTDIVTKHNYFYSEVQRKEIGQDVFGMYPQSPAGSFAMNYYADGMPGGPIDFEIDETGLALWTLVNHAKFLKSDSERCDYFDKVYPSIKLAAQALTECKDTTNNLQCYAFEDDNYVLTQGLQGAVTVYMGLKSAVEAGRALKEDEGVVNAWEERANELREAIFTQLFNHETNSFEGKENGSRAWLIWPAEFYEQGDTVAEREAEALYNLVLPHLLKQSDGAAYLGKMTLALALFWKERPDKFKALEDMILPLVNDVPTRGTRHVGEVFVTLDLLPEGSPDGINDTFDARVAVPHIWEASLNYLSAMALYSPEKFEPLEHGFDELPCPVKAGCGCNSVNGNFALSSLFIFVLLLSGILLLKIIFNTGSNSETPSHWNSGS